MTANYSYVSGDAGAHASFMATLNTVSTNASITVTDTVNAGITGTQMNIQVVTMQPTASLSGPSAAVPGQPLTYPLGASETGLPANTSYTYSLNWGSNPTAQMLSGISSTLAP